MLNPKTEVNVPEVNEREVFVGPRPFERSEQNLFFGRDREISELLSLVTSNRVVLCYAPSGAGKTSLINAGLQPRLEKEGFEVLPSTRVRGLIPEGIDQKDIPNIYIFNAILSLSKETGELSELARSTLAEFLSTVPHLTDEEDFPSPRILIFDQFEELLTSYLERWQERDGFFHQVYDALQADPLLRALFVMREDYVARVEPFLRILKPLQQTRFRLDLLGPSGAHAAVTGPLRGTQRHFKDGVVNSLIEELLKVRVESTLGEATEVVGEYVEPVQLQVVCRNLWNSLPADVQEISQEHLKAYGDVDQALRDFYESCLTGAKTGLHANEADLRQWFERQLITPAGTRSIVFRDAQQTAGLSNAVVDFLENKHVIRGEWRAGSRWYELTHDRLIEPIQRANARWRSQRQQRRNRIFGLAAGGVVLTLLLFSVILSLQQTSYASPPSAYTQSASTVVAYQTVVQEQVDVAQEQVAVAQENVAISQSRQLAAQALLTDDPELARLLAVQANLFSDTQESRRTLHRILSRQSVADGEFLRAFNPNIISPTLVKRLSNQEKKWVISVAFSPDSRRFISGGQDGTMNMWDPNSTTEVSSAFRGHQSNVQQVTFSPDGKTIASVALDARVLLWDALSGAPIGEPLLGHEGLVNSVAFSPDGKRLATGGQDGTIRIWDLATRESRVLLQPAEVSDVAWSPDGKTLAAASAGSTVRLFETESFNDYRALLGANGDVKSIAWSPDGRMLAAGAVVENQNNEPIGGGTVVWDVETRTAVARPLQQSIQAVWSVTFDPTGKTLAMGRTDGTIALWDVSSEQSLVNPLKAHSHWVMSIAFSPDGRYMISGSIDGTIGLWNTLAPTRALTINPTGDLLATNQASVINIWDLSAGQADQVKIIAGHTNDIVALAFSPDGNTLVSSAMDKMIGFWDINTGIQKEKWISTESNVPTLQYSPDGSAVAVAGENGRVQLFDLATDSLLTLREQGGPVLKLQFGADGNTLDVVGRDGVLTTFDLTSEDPQQQIPQGIPLPSSQGGITGVALSLDGQRAAYFQQGSAGAGPVLAEDGRAHGIALSYWDQSFNPNVNRDDIDFVIIKATEGTQFVDPKFDEFVQAIQSVPMRGVYHYFRESVPWQEQADHFLSTVKDKGFNFYLLDLEVRTQDGSTDFLGDAEQWLKYVDEQVEGPVLLMAISFYLNEFGTSGEWMKDWPLMALYYPSTPDRNGSPELPEGFRDWKIWNYTDNGNGAEYGVGTDNVYLVVYNGTPAEMGQWLGFSAFTILDRATGKPLNPKQAIQVTSSNGIAFSPDGNYLAAADSDGVSLLNAKTGDEISTLYRNGPSALSLGFLPSGNGLVIGTDDGGVLIWDLSLLQEDVVAQPMLDIACSQVKRNLSADEWTQFVGADIAYQSTCPNLPTP